MREPRRVSRRARKQETRDWRPRWAVHNPALRMETPPRLLRSRRRLLLLRQSYSHREILPRAFPFRRRASNPAFPAARRTERSAPVEAQAAGREAVGEREQAMLAGKTAGT